VDLTIIVEVLKIVAALVVVYAAVRFGEYLAWMQMFSRRYWK